MTWDYDLARARCVEVPEENGGENMWRLSWTTADLRAIIRCYRSQVLRSCLFVFCARELKL